MSVLLTALYLTVPLIVAGVLHMAIVRFNVLSALRVPIHERLFGPNKTWRGAVVMPIVTTLGVYVGRAVDPIFGPSLLVSYRSVSPILVGCVLGVAYVLAELPNSWWKRRLGIAPGELPQTNRFLFALLDQADSAIGCVIALYFLMSVPVAVLAVVVIIGPAVHLVVNLSLYLAGLRKRPI